MSAKNLVIASLIGAALTVVFSTAPILSCSNCLLCAPYWASAIFAVWIYRRLTGTLTLGQGVIIGLVAGLIAGFIGFLLDVIGIVGSAETLNTVRSLVPSNSGINIPSGTSVHFSCGIGLGFIISAIGGSIGGAIFRTDKGTPAPSDSIKPMNP
jgi:hypothetical protein